jgi:hypothetical protein
VHLVTTTNGRRDEMSKKLITTIALSATLAMLGGASTALGDPLSGPPSPGACNMLHANDAGLAGMMNDPHVFDIMIPEILASLEAGCVHP